MFRQIFVIYMWHQKRTAKKYLYHKMLCELQKNEKERNLKKQPKYKTSEQAKKLDSKKTV